MSGEMTTAIAAGTTFLLGGGGGFLFWRATNKKMNAEGTDVIAQAAEKVVALMAGQVASLHQEIADLKTAQRESNEDCAASIRALSAEVIRLGGNPMLIVSTRRRQHRAGD